MNRYAIALYNDIWQGRMTEQRRLKIDLNHWKEYTGGVDYTTGRKDYVVISRLGLQDYQTLSFK
jgi:hypothetical protein